MKVLINIDVPDLDRAIAFYTAALGLHHNRTIEDDVAELSGTSSLIYLLQNPAGSSPVNRHALTRNYARHWTPVHMDFVVDDVMKAAKRAIEAGATRESECVEWNGSRCITFSDPFGHGFCLIEFERDGYGAGGPVRITDCSHSLPAGAGEKAQT